MRSACFALVCLSAACVAAEDSFAGQDAWDMTDFEEVDFADVEAAAAVSRTLIGSGTGSAGTLSCVKGDDADDPAAGESNSPDCWCNAADKDGQPCKVFKTSPPAYYCRSMAGALAWKNIASGNPWQTAPDEAGVSDCTIQVTPAPTPPPTPNVVPTPPTPSPTPAPTPAPTFAPGSFEVKTPTTLTGLPLSAFTIGVQYAYRKAFAAECTGTEEFKVGDVTLYDIAATRRRLAAGSVITFTTGIKVDSEVSGQKLQVVIKAVTPANLQKQLRTELATVIASKRFPDLDGKDAATLTADITVAKQAPEVNQIPVPTPAPAPPADKTPAIVGGVCGGLIVAGLAYKLNERAKLNPLDGAEVKDGSAVAHQGQL